MFLRTTAIGLLALLVLACGDDAGGMDAGLDAGADLGRDMARDLGRDTGPPDLRPPDVGADLGPDDPEWVAVWDDLPPSCAMERATHPERTLVPVWGSCGEGCQYLLPDPRYHRDYNRPVGWSDGETGYFVMRQVPAGTTTVTSAQVNVVASIARTHLALRSQPGPNDRVCIWTAYAGQGEMFATTAYIRESAGSFEWRAVRMPFVGPFDYVVTVPDEDTPSSVLQAGALGSQVYAVEVQPLAQIFAIADGTMTPMGGALGAVRGIPQNEMAIGDTALWEAWGGADIPIVYGRPGTPGAIYHAVEGARLIGTDVDEDTGTIAWTQGYGYQGSGRYERLELWAADFVRDPDDLEPRWVAGLGTGNSGTLDGGQYARLRTLPERGRGIEVVDLATGRAAFIDPIEGIAYRGEVLWINQTEIAVAASIIPEIEATVVRVRLDSLTFE